VLDFGFQTAVLVQDGGLRGILDAEDEVVHAYHALVERVPYGVLPYTKGPMVVRRWR
jgi:hypothetical protein